MRWSVKHPETKPEFIYPGILMPGGGTIYPTGVEWIVAFALKGCQWAIDEIESGRLERSQAKLWLGENI